MSFIIKKNYKYFINFEYYIDNFTDRITEPYQLLVAYSLYFFTNEHFLGFFQKKKKKKPWCSIGRQEY